MKRELALVSVLVTTAALAATPARGEDARPGAPPTVESENGRCASCHTEIAAEWSASLHRSSFRDASFQRGFAIERLPSCRKCHAPEAEPASAKPDAWAAEHGVARTTCHGTTAHAHEKTRRADLGTKLCAGCHEFGFPEHDRDPVAPKHAPANRMMQRTASEHAESPHAEKSCASCHLPKVGDGAARHASHRFDVTRNEGVLRAALSVSARRDASAVVLDLAPNGVGHAFPTGDMFRRIRIEVLVGGDAAHPAFRFERRLARTFGVADGRKVEVADTRLTGKAVFTFPLPAAAATQPARYRVTYQRLTVAAMNPALTRGPEHVEQEVTLAEGVVP